LFVQGEIHAQRRAANFPDFYGIVQCMCGNGEKTDFYIHTTCFIFFNYLSKRERGGDAGYGGPCPPVGRHRYFHKLYALDTVLPDLKQPTKAKLEKAMEGHVILHVALVGLYQRK
jgi:phosphatidylethanolamine-binding protein (PEBP) family uncharacterized protein